MCYWSLDLIFKAKLKLRVQKMKNPIWSPGSHFESDITENQNASAHSHKQHAYEIWNWNSKANLSNALETMSPTESRYRKIQYGHQAAVLKGTLLKISRFLSIHTSDVLLKFGLDIQSQTKVKSPETEKFNMAARQPFWKWHCWKSINFCP